MKALYIKELKSIFGSSSGLFFALIYLIAIGFMLWFFSGNFNIPLNGYASLSSFFRISPALFTILIPALTMRLFAEEKRLKTLDILKSRPVSFSSIYFSKFFACSIFIFIIILSTSIYVFSIYQLANPIGNIDIQSILVSYISLYLIALIFISIGLFTSMISSNQIVSLLLSILICFFSFYGFDLLSELFLSGKVQSILSSIGINHHYSLMQRGVIQTNNLITIFNYLIVFFILTLLINKTSKNIIIKYIGVLFIINFIFLFIPNIRFDFTVDKRYSLSDYSKNLLSELKDKKENISIDVYLEGDLNASFLHLQEATNDILSDFNQYAGNTIDIKYKNPSIYKVDRPDMPGILLNETTREGKVSQKMIYPYAQVICENDTLIVPLLKNISGYTADENIHISIENLEFEFIDAIRILNQENSQSIAFIEGHGELERQYVYDAEELLSKYYFVNRGQIGNDISELENFSVIIIAGPRHQYSESEKYIIDQYIMNGGKVLWLLDGAIYSNLELIENGYSASMKNDANLNDLLFSYGIRVNSDFVQDSQCLSIYMATGNDKQSQPTIMPCYYMPLLIPSHDNPITQNIRDVKSAFVSSLDIINSSSNIEKKVLLTTSANSHIVKVPDPIDFDIQRVQNESSYFDQSFIPISVSLEGSFGSAFTNRLIPENILSDKPFLNVSKPTKMIIVASSDIIRNNVRGQGVNTQILPMGFDVVSQQQFGNRDFIVNAVNWLTDNEGWMELRTKQQQMHILNKNAVYESQNKYAIINIIIPTSFILLIMGCTYIYRRKKYGK